MLTLFIQMFNNLGISGNASVVNIGGDYIMHDNDGLGAEMHAVLESIEQRLNVVHDEKLGTSFPWVFCPSVLIMIR